MDRLLSAYLANPCDKTKTKLLNYLAKHPMAACFATPEQLRLIRSLENDNTLSMSYSLKDWLSHIAKVGIFPTITAHNLAEFENVADKFWVSYNERFETSTKKMRDSK
jgi:hypothetical protein